MNWINQMETTVKPELVVKEKEEDLKKPKTPKSEKEEKEKKKVVKTVICVDYDSEASDEDYYDMSDSSSDDLFEECKDELWKIE